MKKMLFFATMGLSAFAVTSYGQGFITLDNYSSGSNLPITFGVGVPLNGFSGAVASPGTPLNSAWTIGLYWTAGTVALSDPAGIGIPIAPLALGTGPGSTAVIGAENAGGNPGFFGSFAAFNSGSTLNTTITLEVIAYPTASGSYAAAINRAHSAAFSMPTVAASSPNPIYVGDYMTPFSVSALDSGNGYYPVPVIPEPTTLALAGLSFMSLLVLRRR